MKTSRYSDIRIRGILKQAEVGLLINFQDTHRKNVAAYIKKLGLRFSIIVGVLVNIVLVNIGVLSYLQKILKQH